MVMVENIKYEGKTIARIIGAEELGGPFKFFTEDSDNIQISRWNHPIGYKCKPHMHNIVNKTIERTHEAIFVLHGEIKVTFFSFEGQFITSRILVAPCICYSMDCGHGYEVYSKDTRVIEFKNGPFLGDEHYDKERTLLDDWLDPNNFFAHEQV